MIAFFSESKAVTIHINNFNEQYLDIIALFVIWIVVLIGLIFMIKAIRKEKPKRDRLYDYDKTPAFSKSKLSYDFKSGKNKSPFIGFISQESNNDDEKKI